MDLASKKLYPYNISLQKLLAEKEIASSTSTETENNRSVFVVYGHDENAKTELEAMLRRWEINPIFLDQLPSEGQTIIEKLEIESSAITIILASKTIPVFAKQNATGFPV